MKYDIRKNWLETFNFIKANPIALLPFLYIGLFEGIALEISWFSTRFPFSYIVNPIIRKIYGENFVHYPGVMLILPDLFYVGQIIVWTFLGAFLASITMNIFKNLIDGLPIKFEDLMKKAMSNYFWFSGLAVVVGVLFYAMTIVSTNVFAKVLGLTPIIVILYIFKFILLTLVISTVPLMVFYDMKFFGALKKSIGIAVTRFTTLFTLVIGPFLLYFPVFFAKNFCAERYAKTMPDINLYLSAVGIIVCMFLGCFIALSASRFVLDCTQTAEGKTT